MRKLLLSSYPVKIRRILCLNQNTFALFNHTIQVRL